MMKIQVLILFAVAFFLVESSGFSINFPSPSRLSYKNTIIPNIVGGEPSLPHAHPYEVSLQLRGDADRWHHFCGGSIVEPNKIITAAHCLAFLDDENIRVVAGEHDFSLDEGTEQIVAVNYTKSHPFFNHTTMDYDYAIVYLKTPLTFNGYVKQIWLAESVFPGDRQNNCVVVGWGNTDDTIGGENYPNVLQQVAVNIVPHDECASKYAPHGETVTDRMICAGGVKGQDSCYGDSGGPLICKASNGMQLPYLAGIVSWGKPPNCGQQGYPGVYSNVLSVGWTDDDQTFSCPYSDHIRPCNCGQSTVVCSGVGQPGDVLPLTQEDLENLLKKVRGANWLAHGETLKLQGVTITFTAIEKIDLTPLLNTKLDKLSIVRNQNLQLISASATSPSRSIEVNHLEIWLNDALTDQSVEDIFSHFGTSMTKLTLSGSQITLTSQKLRGHINSLVNLKSLDLKNNKIFHLGMGQFKSLGNLDTLDLGGNPLAGGVEDGAFIFDPPGSGSLSLGLSATGMPADGLDLTRIGLVSSNRTFVVSLGSDGIEFLSEVNFKAFLLAHSQNQLSLYNLYSFTCDQRMSWLKYSPQISFTQVWGAYCSNDPGKDVFNSNLIPRP